MSKAKTTAIKEKQTKTQIIAAVAEETGLSKKEVQAVLQSTKALAGRHLAKNGSGEFTVPEVGVKLRRVQKPARKAGRNGTQPLHRRDGESGSPPGKLIGSCYRYEGD